MSTKSSGSNESSIKNGLAMSNKSVTKLTPILLTRHTINTIKSIDVKTARAYIRQMLNVRDSTSLDNYTVTFNDCSHLEQEFIFTICAKLGLKYIPDLSPVVSRCIIPRRKQVLIQLTHTPKCGGMSLKNNLHKLNELFEPRSFPKKFVFQTNKDYTIVLTDGHQPSRNFTPNAVRVAFIRDPINRLESAFKYIKYGTLDRRVPNEFNDWSHILDKYEYANDLIQNKTDFKNLTNKNTGIEHLFPLSYWLCDSKKNILVDYVLRQEHLEEDWNKLLKIIGVKQQKLERINVTAAPKTTAYKINRELYNSLYPDDYKIYKKLEKTIINQNDTFRKKFMKQLVFN